MRAKAGPARPWRDPAGNELANYSEDGFVGGLQGGYNWQTGAWVLGIEADATWGHIRKGVIWVDPDPSPWIDPNPDPATGRTVVVTKRIGTTVDNLGTVAARVGYAFDRVLVYGKGGGAWAHDIYRAFNANTANETLLASARDTRWGWIAGIGIEYGLTANWSVKAEYNYIDLGTERIALVGVPGVLPASRAFDVKQDISLMKIGINYRFAP